MTSLKRDPRSGDWTARKGIPKGVREAYGRLAGGAWEASFRRPGALNATEAKRQFADWLSEVEGRVSRLRDEANGLGVTLSTTQSRALAGEWYVWFLARHEQEPGEAETWAGFLDDLHDTATRYAPTGRKGVTDAELDRWERLDNPKVLVAVQRRLVFLSEVEAFLSELQVVLGPETRDTFLGFLHADFNAAMAVLIDRCGGVYKADLRATTFPRFEITKPASGLTCWRLFEAWVERRKPAPATVNRWRCVFQDLEAHFPERPAASVQEHEARAWKDGLLTASRTPATVRDIWVNAANTVFG